MRRTGILIAAALLGLLVGCGQETKTPEPESGVTGLYTTTEDGVSESYLEGFSSVTDTGTGAPAPLDLAADEGLLLADRCNLATTPGGTDGPVLLLSTKFKVLNVENGWTKIQLPDGQVGWVASGLIAREVRRAVLKSSGPDGWPALSFVGYQTIEGETDKVKILGAGAAASSEPRSTTVARKILATSSNDVNLIVLWRLAALESEPAVQSTLLNQGLSRYASSIYATMVQEKLDSMSGKTVLPTTEVSLIVSAIGDDTKVWPEPAEKGNPATTLAAGQQVQVVEQTTETQTVNGVSARWYKIADPAGWVFGATVKE